MDSQSVLGGKENRFFAAWDFNTVKKNSVQNRIATITTPASKSLILTFHIGTARFSQTTLVASVA